MNNAIDMKTLKLINDIQIKNNIRRKYNFVEMFINFYNLDILWLSNFKKVSKIIITSIIIIVTFIVIIATQIRIKDSDIFNNLFILYIWSKLICIMRHNKSMTAILNRLKKIYINIERLFTLDKS